MSLKILKSTSKINLIQGSAADPSLSFGDGDTGFYEQSDDILNVAIAGVASWFWSSDTFGPAGFSGPRFLRETVSATNPTIILADADPDTGIGWHSADNLSLISGGAEAVRVEDPADLGATETSLWLYDDDNGTMEQVTVGIADSGGAGFKVLRITN